MKKMAAETRRMLFWLSKTFSSRWLPLTGLGQIQRKTKNPVFITFFGLKDCGGFKGRQEMLRYQVVRVEIVKKLIDHKDRCVCVWYSLSWPIRGGSARKGYLFQASVI